MSNAFELQAEVREQVGKAVSRRLRNLENKVPAVVYGAGKETAWLTLDHNKVITALKNEAFHSHILTLKVADGEEKVVLKEVQRHPFKPVIMHMDFLRINLKEKLHMRVPLHFIGESKAAGVKDGGIVSHDMTEMQISCLPSNLPEYIEIDISNLPLNGVVHLSDIKLPEGVESSELAHGNDLPVASIHLPRAALAEEEGPIAAPETEILSEQKVSEREAADKKKS